jgi:hypothetical protein
MIKSTIQILFGFLFALAISIAVISFMPNPLSPNNGSARYRDAIEAIEMHTLQQKSDILVFCKSEMLEAELKNRENGSFLRRSIVGRRYDKDGIGIVLESIPELPFLKFDLIRINNFRCEVFLYKEFDGGVSYYVEQSQGGEYELFSLNRSSGESTRKVDFHKSS